MQLIRRSVGRCQGSHGNLGVKKRLITWSVARYACTEGRTAGDS